MSEPISDYSKVAGYNVNVQKIIACLYNSNEQLEFEITNTIYICPLKVKYLDTNLTKYEQTLDENNYKTL